MKSIQFFGMLLNYSAKLLQKLSTKNGLQSCEMLIYEKQELDCRISHRLQDYWIGLVTTDGHGRTMHFDVQIGIVVSNIWTTMSTRDRFTDDVGMFHGDQRNIQTNQVSDISGPSTGSIQNTICSYFSIRSFDASHLFPSVIIFFSEYPAHRTIFNDLAMEK